VKEKEGEIKPNRKMGRATRSVIADGALFVFLMMLRGI
jgi:hypothetical protein